MRKAMDWSLFATIILNSLAAALILLALVTGRLAACSASRDRPLFVFLGLLLANHVTGFLVSVASAQTGFNEALAISRTASVSLGLCILVLQYGIFVSTAYLVPCILGVSPIGPLSLVVYILSGVLLTLRLLGIVPLSGILLGETVFILPLVYVIWIASLVRSNKKDRLFFFLFITLIPSGLLERAAVDPLWPTPVEVRNILSKLPLTITVIIISTLMLIRRNIRCINGSKSQNQCSPDLSAFSLSPREMEIATLLFKGYANKEIAQELSISYGTVKNYVHSLYSKLGIRTRFELRKFTVRS
ncbi:MAG: helix-turn-helix transcriptional regulator [Spirochaetales bacterium]|nr:helix-turn-helix transcriptional regulator [Spirochaetales bacterium]